MARSPDMIPVDYVYCVLEVKPSDQCDGLIRVCDTEHDALNFKGGLEAECIRNGGKSQFIVRRYDVLSYPK